ncbi:hypothetical protein LINPERHAP1_LOCUS25122 [Linum perenne]
MEELKLGKNELRGGLGIDPVTSGSRVWSPGPVPALVEPAGSGYSIIRLIG